MLYVPILRSRQSELDALGQSVNLLGATSSVLPVVEPVNNCSLTIRQLVAFGVRLGLIMNPKYGIFAGGAVLPEVASLGDDVNVIPMIRVEVRTTPQDVASFVVRYPRYAVFYAERPAADVAVAQQISSSGPTYILINHNVVSANRALGVARHVDVDRRLLRKDRNEDYTPDEFYTDRHLTLPDSNFSHFGDYSIVDDFFSDDAPAPRTVALHHVYLEGQPPSNLRVKHFVSAQRGTVGNLRAKWNDALTQLVNALPALQALAAENDTPACAEYRSMLSAGKYTGLGPMKTLAIKHHIQLMDAIL